MSIYKDNIKIKNIYKGNTKIAKIYKKNQLIYSSEYNENNTLSEEFYEILSNILNEYTLSTEDITKAQVLDLLDEIIGGVNNE